MDNSFITHKQVVSTLICFIAYDDDFLLYKYMCALVFQLSSLAMKVCVLYYGGILVTRGGISSGDLVSFILYELQFSSAVEVRNKDLL